MKFLLQRTKALVLALTMLALSAGLVLGSMPPAAWPGLSNAADHAGKTVPVAGGDETLGEDGDEDTDEDSDEDTDEDADEDSDVDADEDSDEDTDEDSDEDTDEDAESAAEGAGGEHCATDPSTLTPEELEAMNHGSVVCWAAHQTEWPEWFANHGAFVRCWAHQGKLDATSCTEDPNAEEGTEDGTEVDPAADTTSVGKGNGHGKGHANGKGKAKGKLKHAA